MPSGVTMRAGLATMPEITPIEFERPHVRTAKKSSRPTVDFGDPAFGSSSAVGFAAQQRHGVQRAGTRRVRAAWPFAAAGGDARRAGVAAASGVARLRHRPRAI